MKCDYYSLYIADCYTHLGCYTPRSSSGVFLSYNETL